MPRLSAAQQVGKVLRDHIINGQLTHGTRLTEETITEALGYSRNTIRESFALLAAERLVVRAAGLEPAHPKALEPKSSASANSATRARRPL